jgi:hypothetical protein
LLAHLPDAGVVEQARDTAEVVDALATRRRVITPPHLLGW